MEQVNQLIEAYIHLAALPASSDVGTSAEKCNPVCPFTLPKALCMC